VQGPGIQRPARRLHKQPQTGGRKDCQEDRGCQMSVALPAQPNRPNRPFPASPASARSPSAACSEEFSKHQP
jgi:hypothetical protein